MVAKGGAKLISEDAIKILKDQLIKKLILSHQYSRSRSSYQNKD